MDPKPPKEDSETATLMPDEGNAPRFLTTETVQAAGRILLFSTMLLSLASWAPELLQAFPEEFHAPTIPRPEFLWWTRSSGIALGLLVVAVMSVVPAFFPEVICGASESIKAHWLYRFMHILLAVFAFMVAGPTLILANKHVMQGLRFDYPLTLGGIGVLCSAIVSRLCVSVGWVNVRAESHSVAGGRRWFAVALPIGVLRAATLGTGNAVYMFLGVGFIQMLKAFTPTIVICVTRVLNASSLPPLPALWCAGIIVIGTLLEVKGEMHFSLVGVVLMLTSEVCEAVSLVLGEVLLQNHKFTVMETMYFIAPASALCLACVAAVMEWPRMYHEGGFQIILDNLEQFALCSVLGVAVNFLSLLVIQATSTLTLKILNAARCVGLVVVGVLFYQETVSFLGGIGYGITMIGFAGYNYLQMNSELAYSIERRVAAACPGLWRCSKCSSVLEPMKP